MRGEGERVESPRGGEGGRVESPRNSSGALERYQPMNGTKYLYSVPIIINLLCTIRCMAYRLAFHVETNKQET